MNIKVQSRGFSLSQSLYDRVTSKLHLAIGHYGGRIRQVDVTLQDINGPRGGEDMQCVIKLKVNHFKSIVIHETAPNMYDAINSCAQRVRRVVERHFNRVRRLNRRIGYSYG